MTLRTPATLYPHPSLTGRAGRTGLTSACGVDIVRAFADHRTRLVLQLDEMIKKLEEEQQKKQQACNKPSTQPRSNTPKQESTIFDTTRTPGDQPVVPVLRPVRVQVDRERRVAGEPVLVSVLDDARLDAHVRGA